ncbi:MAG: carbohydrate ABC transporter permease [Clostridia bacterium]|nr:carbohydrate ABC transporter permease [Clostridia bacterium]
MVSKYGYKYKYKHVTPVIYKRRPGQRVPFIIAFVIFFLYSASLIVPAFLMLMNSFKEAIEYNEQLFTGTALYTFPTKFVFENYRLAFELLKVPAGAREVYFPEMLWQTAWTSTIPPLICMYSQVSFAYACARYKFFGVKFLFGFNLALMIIPIFGTTATSLKLYMALGIYNTPWCLIVTAVSGFGMSMFIYGGFFKGVSWEYAEAVFIDGGGHFTVFFRIMFPQVRSMILVFFIGSVLGNYTEYASRLLFVPDIITIAVGLYYESMILPRSGNSPAYFAALYVSAIPILMFYIIFGKTFMTSMNIGGLKG